MSNKSSINVPHLARLARLSLSAEEISAATEDLQQIVDMIDQMQSVDTNGIEPMAHPLDSTQRLRQDIVTEQVNPDNFQKHAPATEDHFYLVPRVVE